MPHDNDAGLVQTNDAPQSPQQQQVEMWAARVKKAKKHHSKAFEQMKEDMQFARGLQWPGQKDLEDPRYKVNIVQRHLRQREAALYAKNPKAVANRRKTLDFAVWDGDPNKLLEAQQTVMMAQQVMAQAQTTGDIILAQQAQMQMMEPQALLQDYQDGMARRAQLDKMAKTLEIVWQHQVGEQQPPFKASMKHLVRRTLTTGVGYLKMGYHRFQEYRPEDVSRVTDLTEQVAALQASMAEMEQDSSEFDETSAQLGELQDLLQKVTGDQQAFIREGLDLDFPRSTSIIPDPDCFQLDGFLGARWVAQEWLLTPKQVQEVYGVDIKTSYTHFSQTGEELGKDAVASLLEDDKEPDTRALVWEIWDKHQGQTFTVALGHPDFLIAPKTPEVHLERFWPFFVITFNGLEDEEQLFPPSDVRLVHDMQVEMNLMRQRLREHRDAARPGHVTSKGMLDEEDKKKFEHRLAHHVLELNGLREGGKISDILQPVPTNPIDPNQYEVGQVQDDVFKVLGTQEAVMGGLSSNASATESSISESARLSSVGSSVDELDDFLTQVAKTASHLLFTQMSQEQAMQIAGPGGVWPDVSGEEVAQDLWLEIRAGSSGRPNKSAEIQNLERLMPFLIQIPGVRSDKILEQIIERLDDRLDPADFFDPNLPSMVAANQQVQPGTGDPATDPNQQGGEGSDQTAVGQGDSNLGPRPPQQPRVMDPNRV